MARNVNATFSGVVVSDVDPNALTRTRWLDESVADTALVHDLVTGKNTPPTTLDHSGGGAGCVLGLPVANQVLSRFPAYNIQGDGDTSDTDAASIWAVPSKQPAGETTIQVRVSLNRTPPAGEMTLEVRNTSWAVVASGAIVFPQQGGAVVGAGEVDGLTGGTQYYYRLVVDDISRWEGGGVDLWSVTLGWFRQVASDRPLIRRLSSDVTDSTELSTKTASSATVIDFKDLDTAETQDGQAISGYHTTTLAQNQHALAEMLTGAPAGTNENRTLAASASQSTFYDHSRQGSEFSSMPLLAHFPLFACAFGVVPEDGGTGEDGVGGFNAGTNAPGWKATGSTSYQSLSDMDFWAPYADTNKMRFQVLATAPDNDLSNVTQDAQIDVFNGNTGASVGTVNAGFVQLGSSKWWRAEFPAVAHVQGGANRARLSVRLDTGSKPPQTDGSELRIVGWAAWIED
jgi:hypothetical protein